MLEADDYGNHERLQPFVDACREASLLGGIWETNPSAGSTNYWISQWMSTDPDFFILEAERFEDWPSIVTAIHNAGLNELPAAVATNLDTWGNPEYFKPMIEAGWSCLTECYMHDNPQATPPAMEFQAHQVGWDKKKVQPLFGAYGTTPLSYYLERWGDFNPGWSAWSAEYVL